MDAFVVAALENLCRSGEIFGHLGAYVRFDADDAIDGLNSNILFGRIVQRKGDAEHVSPPLMLKTMPPVSLFTDYSQVQFFNEIFFYTQALPLFQQLGDLQSLLPTFYDSRIRLNGRTQDLALVFENLRPRGFRAAAVHPFRDVEQLTLMLRKLGNFHAYSYCAKKRTPKQFHALAKWFRSTQNTITDAVPQFMRTVGLRGLRRLREDARYSHRLADAAKIVDDANDFLDRVCSREREEAMSVMCHGDYTAGNVMVRYANGHPRDLKIIDLAWCKMASPVVDLSTVLYLNADQTTRGLHWDRLIDSYYEGLNEMFGGEGVPSRGDVVNEFNSKAMYGYLIASYYLPISIAADKGMATYQQLLGEEYANRSLDLVPERVLNDAFDTVGGEDGTAASADVLRDIVDRNFI